MATEDFADHLLEGERIVWSGQPSQGLLLSQRDWLLIPLSLIWFCFAVFWETLMLAEARAPLFAQLWGVPFLLLGLFFLGGRFFLDAWLRGHMRYAVTNKRILISRAGAFRRFTAMNIDRLPEATLSERADGYGTIRFGQQVSPWMRGNGFSVWMPALDSTSQFIAIENVRGVFDQIQRGARHIS
jgi:hypothetical protein